MILTNIYKSDIDKDKVYSFLYQLLQERKPEEAISHSGMPTWSEHVTFIERKPYKHWWVLSDIIKNSDLLVGSIYLTYKNEIGIHIKEPYRRKGYATTAINGVMHEANGNPVYANINPANEKSIDLFTKLGFALVQYTYKLERKPYAGT